MVPHFVRHGPELWTTAKDDRKPCATKCQGDSTDPGGGGGLRSNVRIVLEGEKTWELYGNAKNAYTMLNFFNSFNSLFFILILKTEVRIHFVKRNEADALADLNFNSYSKIARLLSSSQKQANEMHIWTR